MKEAELNSPTLSTCTGKDTNYQTETQLIFDYLQDNVCTATMVTAATGIVQKNITRYKRTLEKMGLLWEIDFKPCQITGFKAHYITTNPFLFPQSNSYQLSLFGGSDDGK